jgi:hypothetical protein
MSKVTLRTEALPWNGTLEVDSSVIRAAGFVERVTFEVMRSECVRLGNVEARLKTRIAALEKVAEQSGRVLRGDSPDKLIEALRELDALDAAGEDKP